MTGIFHAFCMVLIASSVVGQVKIVAKLKINWDSDKYLFYQTSDLKKLEFTAENLSQEEINTWKVVENDALKSVKIYENSAC